MRAQRVAEAQRAQRDSVLVALGDLVSEDAVPAVLVQEETNERLHDLGHRLEQQKLSLEMFLQVTNQSSDQLLEALQADATRAVRIDLALRALAREENLEPTDEEVEEELATTAGSMNVSADRLRDEPARLRTGRDLPIRGRQDEGLSLAERPRDLRRSRGRRDRPRTAFAADESDETRRLR